MLKSFRRVKRRGCVGDAAMRGRGEEIMKKRIAGPASAFGCVCVVLILMCTFFVGESFAADDVSGTTTKKEQTVKVDLGKGAAVITVSDPDSWVYAQLQTTGSDTIGEAVAGANLLTTLGQKKTFVVPVKKKQTYYLYLHGTNSGASYTVKNVIRGGTLTSGKEKLSTSYADNKTVIWHTIKIKGSGQLRVTVNDASYRYPGYSKVKLKKDGVIVSGEEHLIRGLGYSTVYGVSAGTYQIGVRSSSELYKIKAVITSIAPAAYGSAKKNAPAVAVKTKTYGIIEPGNTNARWYRVDLPSKADGASKRTIQIKADNSNVVTSGGIQFVMSYKRTSDGKLVSVTKKYLLNNGKENIEFSLFKNKVRTVYIKVLPKEGASGTYRIYWK